MQSLRGGVTVLTELDAIDTSAIVPAESRLPA
jgi:hypothetical protein